MIEDTWPEEEARLEADWLKELIEEGSSEQQLNEWFDKVYPYWDKIFDDKSDLIRFITEFNKHVPEQYNLKYKGD